MLRKDKVTHCIDSVVYGKGTITYLKGERCIINGSWNNYINTDFGTIVCKILRWQNLLLVHFDFVLMFTVHTLQPLAVLHCLYVTHISVVFPALFLITHGKKVWNTLGHNWQNWILEILEEYFFCARCLGSPQKISKIYVGLMPFNYLSIYGLSGLYRGRWEPCPQEHAVTFYLLACSKSVMILWNKRKMMRYMSNYVTWSYSFKSRTLQVFYYSKKCNTKWMPVIL